MVVLPEDLPDYGIDPDRFEIARAVRMSISIPYFFEPVIVKKHVFVDGGILSNFPMWIFDREMVQRRGKAYSDDRLPAGREKSGAEKSNPWADHDVASPVLHDDGRT